MLSLIPGHVFQKLEHRHKTGRLSCKFGFREQFTVMAFIRLAARRSMRDGLRCPGAAGTRLYHWGLKNVARSTLADASTSRPVAFKRCLACRLNDNPAENTRHAPPDEPIAQRLAWSGS